MNDGQLNLLVSYDIAKEGEQVAVLTFIKSAYRLGETVLGIVDINLRGGHTRVVKVGWHSHGHAHPLIKQLSLLVFRLS